MFPVDVVKNYSLKQDIRKLYYLLGFVLTKREAEVLKLRFGLYGCDELTQREIAKRLNIRRSLQPHQQRQYQEQVLLSFLPQVYRPQVEGQPDVGQPLPDPFRGGGAYLCRGGGPDRRGV